MNLTTSVKGIPLALVFIILFTGFLFLFNIGKRDLWAPDEPRYAQVSKEMRDTGRYIVPHLNSAPYPDKPPLLFWLINISSLPFGKITALSARLPSAFAGIGCCIAVFYLAKGLYHNTRIALLSSLILATSSKFLWMTHRVAFDVLLTFFVTMAIFWFYKGYTIQYNANLPHGGDFDKKGIKKYTGFYYTFFYIFMALGVLTKGPIGFILPFHTVLIFLILMGNPGMLKDTKPWIGGILFIIIVSAWVFLASVYGGKEYTNQILFNQNLGRFANSFAHKKPFYYYFINFPLHFLPWSIFIPGFIIYLFSRKGREKISGIPSLRNFKAVILRRFTSPANGAYRIKSFCCLEQDRKFPLLPVIWFAVIFIFFSIASGKRDIYILPLYPAASMLIGWFLNEFIDQSREKYFRKTGYYPCYFLSVISLALCVLLPIIAYKTFPQYIGTTIPFIIILFIAGIIMLWSLRRTYITFFLFTVIFVIFITFTTGTLRAIPILNQYKSAKDICYKAKTVMKPREKLAIFNFFRDPYLFYTDRNYIEVIYGLDNLETFLKSPERVFLFISENDFKKASEIPDIPMFVLEKDSVGHRDMLFVSNRDIE